MKYTDLHVHAHADNPGLTAESLLKTMDKVGLERIALMSWYGRNLNEQKANIEAVSRIIRVCPERLYGLAWIEPRHKTPLDVLEWVIREKKYRGFKMIPNRWYPCEDRILAYCEKMARLGAPCLFHSGILYFETLSSRYCRPVFFEELLKVKDFRFALAHISWPWTDECLALSGQARSAKNNGYSTAEMYIDLTPGTPPDYREEALRKLIDFGAEDAMLFGTDSRVDSLEKSFKSHMQRDSAIFKKLKLSKTTVSKICRDNFRKFFKE